LASLGSAASSGQDRDRAGAADARLLHPLEVDDADAVVGDRPEVRDLGLREVPLACVTRKFVDMPAANFFSSASRRSAARRRAACVRPRA
jgi:hypothetical protein